VAVARVRLHRVAGTARGEYTSSLLIVDSYSPLDALPCINQSLSTRCCKLKISHAKTKNTVLAALPFETSFFFVLRNLTILLLLVAVVICAIVCPVLTGPEGRIKKKELFRELSFL
jgi:hypothetical protein